MTNLIRFATVASLIVLNGCALNSTVSREEAAAYSQAIKLENLKPPPQTVTVTKTVASPGQLRPQPKEARGSNTHLPVHRVIEKANAAATQRPDVHGYYNAVMVYDYDAGALYRIYCAPLKLTDIQLQPGERIISKPAIGDKVRWKAGVSTSMVNGVEQQHLLITPKRPDLDTTMMIATDRRTYHLELHAYKETYMASVSWNYAEDQLEDFTEQAAEIRRENQLVRTSKVDLSTANFDYAIAVRDGKPAWTPVRAFDDSRKTYIQFPSILAAREAPALFVKKHGEQQIVNYRQKELFYVVDGVFARMELRVGSATQMDVVEIVNGSI